MDDRLAGISDGKSMTSKYKYPKPITKVSWYKEHPIISTEFHDWVAYAHFGPNYISPVNKGWSFERLKSKLYMRPVSFYELYTSLQRVLRINGWMLLDPFSLIKPGRSVRQDSDGWVIIPNQ